MQNPTFGEEGSAELAEAECPRRYALVGVTAVPPPVSRVDECVLAEVSGIFSLLQVFAAVVRQSQ